MSAADLFELLRKIRYDATAIQAKLTDVFALLAELELEDRPPATCSSCGLGFKGPNTLAEHLYTSHDGPLPAHWAHVDELVTLADEPKPEGSEAMSQTERTDSEVTFHSPALPGVETGDPGVAGGAPGKTHPPYGTRGAPSADIAQKNPRKNQGGL